MRKFIILALTTFFYIGCLPFIPGTFGSMAGVFIFYLIKNNTLLHASVVLSLLILGFLLAGRAEKILNKKDARCIVIDEVSGMLLSFFLIPYRIDLVIVGFLIFRLLDALKPYPIGRLENLRGSAGIMSDDIVAGLYTNIILQVALRLTLFKAS